MLLAKLQSHGLVQARYCSKPVALPCWCGETSNEGTSGVVPLLRVDGSDTSI
jgi:hypothetical protein